MHSGNTQRRFFLTFSPTSGLAAVAPSPTDPGKTEVFSAGWDSCGGKNKSDIEHPFGKYAYLILGDPRNVPAHDGTSLSIRERNRALLRHLEFLSRPSRLAAENTTEVEDSRMSPPPLLMGFTPL
jgi:hypothetical protein